MNSGFRTIILFMFPVIAIFACAAVSLSIRVAKPHMQTRPQFMDIIDRLGISPDTAGGHSVPVGIRNVFSHEDLEKKDPVPEEPAAAAPAHPPAEKAHGREEKQLDHDPVWVSMIVDGGETSFCVINGRKMRVGDRSEDFTLTSIRKGSVTIRHIDGIEETIHVKAF